MILKIFLVKKIETKINMNATKDFIQASVFFLNKKYIKVRKQ